MSADRQDRNDGDHVDEDSGTGLSYHTGQDAPSSARGCNSNGDKVVEGFVTGGGCLDFTTTDEPTVASARAECEHVRTPSQVRMPSLRAEASGHVKEFDYSTLVG